MDGFDARNGLDALVIEAGPSGLIAAWRTAPWLIWAASGAVPARQGRVWWPAAKSLRAGRGTWKGRSKPANRLRRL
jgi:hypothetical protein